jgi:hypothetical protein
MDDHELRPCTEQAADTLRAAAEDLAQALLRHATAVTAIGGRDAPAVFAAGDAVTPAVLAYARAHFEYTGCGAPLQTAYDGGDEGGDGTGADDPPEVAALTGTALTVLQRRDYVVTDETELAAAGRAAYRRVWPEDDEAMAAADVTSPGRALYQIAHADGWENLDQAAGLEPTGAAVIVVQQETPLSGSPEGWPDALFSLDDRDVLYEQRDAYY